LIIGVGKSSPCVCYVVVDETLGRVVHTPGHQYFFTGKNNASLIVESNWRCCKDWRPRLSGQIKLLVFVVAKHYEGIPPGKSAAKQD